MASRKPKKSAPRSKSKVTREDSDSDSDIEYLPSIGSVYTSVLQRQAYDFEYEKPKKKTTVKKPIPKKEPETKRTLRSSSKYKDFNSNVKKDNDFSLDDFLDDYVEDKKYYKNKVDTILEDFKIPKENRREGNKKSSSYTYLLLDSRKCSNPSEMTWDEFQESIFYVGKGTNNRAFQHVKEARKSNAKSPKKNNYIKEILNDGEPVKILKVKENINDEEALTREAAMIDALGKRNLTNIKSGTYHGVASVIPVRDKLEMGGALLVDAFKTMKIKGSIDQYED